MLTKIIQLAHHCGIF